MKTRKNNSQNLLIIGPFFFRIANQPTSHFLYHKNVSLRDIYIMTLLNLLVANDLLVMIWA